MGDVVSTMAEEIFESEGNVPSEMTDIVLTRPQHDQTAMNLGTEEYTNNYRTPYSGNHVTSPGHVTKQCADHVTSQCPDSHVTMQFTDGQNLSNRKRSIDQKYDNNYVTKVARHSDAGSVPESSESPPEPLEFHKFVDQKLNKNKAISNDGFTQDGRLFNQFMHRESDIVCGIHNGNGKYRHLSGGSTCNCGCDSESYLKKMLETSNMIGPCASCDNNQNGHNVRSRSADEYRPSTQQLNSVNMEVKLDCNSYDRGLGNQGDYIKHQADKMAPRNNMSNFNMSTVIPEEPRKTAHSTGARSEAYVYSRPCSAHHAGTPLASPDQQSNARESPSTNHMRESPVRSLERHGPTKRSPDYTLSRGCSENGPPPLIHIQETKPNKCQSQTDVKCTCNASKRSVTSRNDDQPLNLSTTNADNSAPLDLSMKPTNLKVPPRRQSTGALTHTALPADNWSTCTPAQVVPALTYEPPPPYPPPQCNGNCSSSSVSQHQPMKQTSSHFVYPEAPPSVQPGLVYRTHDQHPQNHLPLCHVHVGVGRGAMMPPDGSLQHQIPPVPGSLQAFMLTPKPFKRGRGRPRTPKSLKALEDALKVRYDLEDILCLVCNICSAYFTRVATLYTHFSKAHEVPLCMDYITVRTITEVRGAMRHHGLNNADVQMMFRELQVFNRGNLNGSPPVNRIPDKMAHSQGVLKPNYNTNPTYYNSVPQKVEYVSRACSPRGGTPINSSLNACNPHISRPASVIIPNTPTGGTPENPSAQQEIIQNGRNSEDVTVETKVVETVSDGEVSQNSVLDYIGDIISQQCADTTEKSAQEDASNLDSIDNEHHTENREEEHSKDQSQEMNQHEHQQTKDKQEIDEIRAEDNVTDCRDIEVGTVLKTTSEKDMRDDLDMPVDLDNKSRATVAVISVECVHECSNVDEVCPANSELFGGRLCIDLD